MYDVAERPGGHADTHHVRADGREVAVDTGFIVHNRRTYPRLTRILDELNVPTRGSEMSLSVRADDAGLEYAGARKLRGLFPRGRPITRSYLRMLAAVPRFHRMARRALAAPAAHDETLGEFLDRGRFTPCFRRFFVTPLVATVWSCEPADAMRFPARYLFRFLDNHGMLQVFGSPQWRTIPGGSQQYVRAIAEAVVEAGGIIACGTKVVTVRDTGTGIEITDGDGATTCHDAVIVATHPPETLSMLAQPTDLQQRVLGAFEYTRNTAQLHTDDRILPSSDDARASWNYRERTDREGLVVTYDLTRLMKLECDRPMLVTLNGPDLVDQSTVLATMEYEHPIYTPAAVAAQSDLAAIGTRRMAFAGAWTGWGFHEDGVRSGEDAVDRIGPVDSAPQRPQVYATRIRHERRAPVHHRFEYGSHIWLVDLDHLPDHGMLGRFEARDHLGDPAQSIRRNVEDFLADHGVATRPARILMAAHSRAFGYCFNPLSVFWCRDSENRLVATVIEVHNTYGQRHAYLVHTDEHGHAQVEKALYVSPFHGSEGTYDIVAPEPDNRLEVEIRLTNRDGSVFRATMRGEPSRPWRAIPDALITSARIRRQGIALWLRRVPIQPRPEEEPR